MKKIKRISLSLLLIGSMVAVFSAQKKESAKLSMAGKKMSKVKLKKLNQSRLKAGKISSLNDKPSCNPGDHQLTQAERTRVNVSGPPPKVCEVYVVLCDKGDGTGGYSKSGPYLRCAERKVEPKAPTKPLEKIMNP